MPVSNELYEQQRTVAEPAENVMFERENFDRKGLRMEFADPQNLDAATDYIEREDKTLPDPRSLQMPVGPTGMGEVAGGGMETIRLDGERWPTYRYAHGFEMNREDENHGVEVQRDYILETMDFLFDLNFMFGMENIGHWNGMADELRTRIPDDRTFDCDDYDNDGSGSESGKPDFSAVPEDLIVGEAGNDELFLLPDMDTVMNEYWDIRETGTPEHYGPIEAREGKVAHDYVARSTMKADPMGKRPDYADAVHLKNVSDLFGT